MMLPPFLYFLMGAMGIPLGTLLLLETKHKVLGVLNFSVGAFNLVLAFA